MMRFASRRQSGMTLIEILVVLVILGLLAGLVVPNVMGKSEKAKYDLGKQMVGRLSMAVENYYLDTGSAPQSLQDLVSRPGNATSWNGPYVKEKDIKDPWGRDFGYRFPGENGEFDLVFYGKDGQPGGEDLNKDHGNWQ